MAEVNISPLQAQGFPRAHPGHSEQNEKRAPGILGKIEDGLDLRAREVCGDMRVALGQN